METTSDLVVTLVIGAGGLAAIVGLVAYYLRSRSKAPPEPPSSGSADT